ncbi:hypothetical protein ANO14919_030700 [Xylariales sp. No.14919]|nr:hypothetical protein ANO14919_030700 [Xylariales sp. No.14919]
MYPTSFELLPLISNHSPPRPLRDQALMTLISSTRQIEQFDISIFERPRQIPGFQKLLYGAIHEHLGLLSRSRSAGQLIGLAFSGSQHLDLVRLREPSVRLIRAALDMEELKGITSISLCLDRVLSISEIIDALESTPSLRDMYFFQTPTHGNDKESADLFVELCKRPHLFRRGRVFFSRAYSAALKQKFWLPTDKDVHPPFDVFPIQHVFFRNQISTGLFRILNHLTPYYVGDSLFRADTFVSGLLHWMLEPDADLRILATSPPSLDDMSRAEIKALPPLVYNRGKVKSTSGFRTEELWPEMRDIVPGSWSVLLSWEDIELELEANRRLEAKVWKYAFVRHRVPIPLDTKGITEAVTLGLEDADVVGIQEFLKITAPHVDLEIVEQRLEELVAKLAAQRHTPSADSALRIPWLSVLEYKEACALLEEFILKGREASMNLREVTLQRERLGAEFYA